MLSVVVISERKIGMVKKGIRKKNQEFNLSHGTNLNSIILCLFFFSFSFFTSKRFCILPLTKALMKTVSQSV